MSLILSVLLIIAIWKWFIYNMSTKGLIFYIGKKFGEHEMPSDDDLEEIISVAIKRTFKISSKY